MTTMISAGFNKIRSTEMFSDISSYDMYMAKNECESCVISIFSEEALSSVVLESKTAFQGLSVEIEKEYFLNTKDGLYPDPLVPINGSFDISADTVTNVLIRFTSYASTKADRYPFVFVLKDQYGNALAEYKVNVKVWNFALPEEHIIETAMLCDRKCINKLHSVADKEDGDTLYKNYYELLLKNRVCAFDIPYDILDERANEYLSDPRMTTFMIDSNLDDETLIKIHEKLSSNPNWLKKAFFYPFDEPLSKEHIETIIKQTARLKKLCPNVRITTPFFCNVPFDDELDEIEVLLTHLDLHCPKNTCFDDDDFTYTLTPTSKEEFKLYRTPEQKAKYGSFKSRMDKAKEKGQGLWQYVCWEPGKPYVNLYVDEEGLDHRILFWQQHLVGAQGFLYWHTNYWRLIDDPWTDMATVSDLSKEIFGDGSLLYNGNKVGINGACSSVRLEAIRDGIEDCEMLAIAAELFGNDWVLEKIAKVTKSLKEYTESPEYFSAVRKEIGDAIEQKFNS